MRKRHSTAKPEMVRAARFERNGSARDVLMVGERAKLAIEPGEVLVRIHAAGVNPSDTKRQARAPLLPGNKRQVPTRMVPGSSTRWAMASLLPDSDSECRFTKLWSQVKLGCRTVRRQSRPRQPCQQSHDREPRSIGRSPTRYAPACEIGGTVPQPRVSFSSGVCIAFKKSASMEQDIAERRNDCLDGYVILYLYGPAEK